MPYASTRAAVMIPPGCVIAPSEASVTTCPAAVTPPPSAMPAGPAISDMPPVPVFVSVPPACVTMPPAISIRLSVALAGAATVSRPVLVTCTTEPATPCVRSPGEARSVRSRVLRSVTAPLASALKPPTALARSSWTEVAFAPVAP